MKAKSKAKIGSGGSAQSICRQIVRHYVAHCLRVHLLLYMLRSRHGLRDRALSLIFCLDSIRLSLKPCVRARIGRQGPIIHSKSQYYRSMRDLRFAVAVPGSIRKSGEFLIRAHCTIHTAGLASHDRVLFLARVRARDKFEWSVPIISTRWSCAFPGVGADPRLRAHPTAEAIQGSLKEIL